MSSCWISATQSMKLWSRIADIFRRDNCVHIFTSYWIMNSNMTLTSVIGSYWWCCTDTVEITTKHRMNRNWTQTLQKRAPGLARFHSFPRTMSFINRIWGFLVKNGRNLESKFVDTFPFDYQNVLAFLIKFEEIIKMYIAVICDLWSCIHCMFTCSF